MSESYLKYDQQQYLTEKCQSKINNEISSLHSCHHSLLKIAIFKKTRENKCWQGCEERETFMNTVGGNVIQ